MKNKLNQRSQLKFCNRLSGIFVLLLLLSNDISYAQLLQWNTFGNAGTETTEPSVFNDPNIVGPVNLTPGTITPAANSNRFGGSGWFNTGNTVTGNTLAEAVAGNDYIQFIVTPNGGFSFTPTSLVFTWDRSSTGPSTVTLRSSADGYTSDLGTVTGLTSGGSATTTTRTITITTLTNVLVATTFRLYGYGATGTSGTGGFDNASSVVDVQLNGSTAATVVSLLSVGPLTPGVNFLTSLGTPSASQTFTLSGSNLTANLDILAVAGYEYSDDGFATAGQSSLMYASATVSKTISVRLTGISLGTFNGSIAISSTGALGSPASIAVNGIVDPITPVINVGALTPPGTFSTNQGAPSGSKTFTVSGTNLVAPLIVASVAGYEFSDDGFVTAGQSSLSYATASVSKTISVRLTGTSAGTFNGSIGISSTSATGSPSSIAVSGNVIVGPVISEVLLPQYMQGVNGSNTNRLPYSCLLTVNTLIPGATYNYFTSVVIASDLASSNGAGNCIFPAPGGFVRTANSSLSTAGNFGTFTANGSGSYTGWFIVEPTGNVRFTPGTNVFIRLMLNDGAGGTGVAARPTTTNSVTVINLNASAGATNGTGLWGTSFATDKNFVVLYDNVNGTGRPVSASFVESDGSANTVANSYANFYTTNVETVSGTYGMVIPNTNANGIRRIEQRTLVNGSLMGCAATDADGIWTGGANTINPTGGTTALELSISDAPLAGNFNVFSSAGAGGTISPSGISSVVCGNDKTYLITPNPCFVIANVTADGVPQGPVSSFTFSNIQSAHFISATFTGATPATVSITNNTGSNVLTCNVTSISLTAIGNGSFLWDNGSTSAARIISTPSTYTVTVTTPQGCTVSSSITIIQAQPVSVSAQSTPVTCFGGSNGTALATPADGLSPYSYVWSNGQTGQTATGLSDGVYTVLVTDAGSCTATVSVGVNQPSQLMVSMTGSTAGCNANAGTVNTLVTGGTAPYGFVWSNGATNSSINGLVAGTYTVLVTDFNNCSVSSQGVVTPALSLTTTSSNIVCHGAATGSIAANVTGGVPVYSYVWNTGSTLSGISGLVAGSYSVTVMDAEGCTKMKTITVSQPASFLIANTAKTNIRCFGSSTGKITVAPFGGTAPYSYLWNTIPTQTTATITGLSAGVYTCTYTDAIGCSKLITITITQPAALTGLQTQSNVTVNGGNDGSATVLAAGGVPGYSYLWNTVPVQTTSTCTALTAGTYKVTVFDSRNCLLKLTYIITQPLLKFCPTTYLIPEDWNVSVSPNPTSGFVNVKVNLEATEKLNLSLSDLSGRILYSKRNMGEAGANQFSFDFANMSKGVYMLKIDNGKSQKVTKLVLQ